MSSRPALNSLEPIPRPSVADQVFETLHDQIIWLELPPGTRMSEVDVSKALEVSRQPVRDAFFRLSKLGFLVIRPQRATTVSLISTRAVQEATFVRTALEVEIIRIACEQLDDANLARLEENMTAQGEAVLAEDAPAFHTLDDAFHQTICDMIEHPFAWQMIRESKAHMDRVRLLSLSFGSQRALDDHRALLEAIKSRDPERAMALMRQHLSRIHEQIGRIRAENPAYFAEEEN